MVLEGVNYNSLDCEYNDQNSLASRKLRLVDSYIEPAGCLLDIGCGTGEFISTVHPKFEKVYGIDISDTSITICKNRFIANHRISIEKTDLKEFIINNPNIKFDYISCLDVLEHLDQNHCDEYIGLMKSILKTDGKLIFTGPGVFEIIRIWLGRSPTHQFSHSSYGWKKSFEKEGFCIVLLESVAFPLLDCHFFRKRMHLFGICCFMLLKREG